MKNSFTLILFLSFVFGFGQDTIANEKAIVEKNEDYNQIFTTVQVQASPPGGMNAFRQYIGSSFVLPVVYQKTIGTVIAKFVIWDDGVLRDIQIIKETPQGLGLGKEAIRVLSNSPKWTPGIYEGRSVKQYYTLPISIQITPAEKAEQPAQELNAPAKKD